MLFFHGGQENNVDNKTPGDVKLEYEPVTLYFDVVNGDGQSLLSSETEGNWISQTISVMANYSDYPQQLIIGEENTNTYQFSWPSVQKIDGRPFFVYGELNRKNGQVQRFNIWWPDRTEDIFEIRFYEERQEDGTVEPGVCYLKGIDKEEYDGPFLRLFKSPLAKRIIQSIPFVKR